MTLRQLHLVHLFAVPAMALVFAVSVHAGATRTFVSTTGNDWNTSANCGPSTPCRTFALSVTNAGGEIVVLTSGGYGSATISQPVVITAIGIDASIAAPFGENGFNVNTMGNVTLIGLRVHGEQVGAIGVLIQAARSVRLYNTLVENFTDTGVFLQANGGNLRISDSKISDNDRFGVSIQGTSSSAYVQGTLFDHNGTGLNVVSGKTIVTDSRAYYNFTGFNSQDILTLNNDRMMFNNFGMVATVGGTVLFTRCLIANNSNAFLVASGGIMSGTNPGTTLITPGQATSGTLSTPITLQ